MLTVVCFLWGRRYSPEHVNRLYRAVKRNLSRAHRFVCICDNGSGLDPDIHRVDIDRSLYAGIKNSRFPKLMIFRPDAAEWLGERILSLDIDSVIVSSLDPLVDRDEDIVLWRNPRFGTNAIAAPYNSSVMLLRAGTRPGVWRGFDPAMTPKLLEELGTRGSDQHWISRNVGNEAAWTSEDGIYSCFEVEDLPSNARIVTFPGKHDPALPETRERYSWIDRYWT